MLMILNDKFLSLEKEAIEMLIESDFENAMMLKEQLSRAVIVERTLTGAGFFTSYYVHPEVKRLGEKNKNPIRSVYAKVSGLKIGVGFILFFKDGVINYLECYEYDSVDFPEEITKYELFNSSDQLQ